MSDHLAVIGDPISHSLSPAMHAAALRAAGLDWTYEPHRVRPHQLSGWVSVVRERPYRGFNVTIPHKWAILEYLDVIDGTAQAVGAVNTVVNDAGRLCGFNTDVTGFLAALETIGVDPEDVHVVVFGAGGAARGVIHALADTASQITVVNRSLDRAQVLAREFRASREIRVLAADSERVLGTLAEADLVVNATSLGMGRQAALNPLPPGSSLRPKSAAIDLVYGARTPFIGAAVRHGCRVADGLEMLVQQGAESFRLWTGALPDIDVMRGACERELERRAC